MTVPAWRAQLRPASFRGVPFFTKSTNGQVGRRFVLHEYPQRDKPYAEDMGRKARSFTVEAYVIGPNYMADRDRLVAALEQPGPGTLVHPYWGTQMVVLAQPASIQESADEGGMARFSLSFGEAGADENPKIRPDTQALVSKSADSALAAIANDFGKSFGVAGFPNFVSQGAINVASGIFSTLGQLSRQFPLDPAGMAELGLHLASQASAISSLIQNPGLLAGSIMSQISGLRAFALSPANAVSMMRRVFDFGMGTSGGFGGTMGPLFSFFSPTTPSRAQQMTNQADLINLVRRAALVEASRASSEVDFPSYNDAVSMLNELAGRLDDEMAGVAASFAPSPAPGTWLPQTNISDQLFSSLDNLRVAVVRDITERGATLSSIVNHAQAMTGPALVAAYRLYGNAARDAEIVSRNGIRHPGFVPGGVPLEVLNA